MSTETTSAGRQWVHLATLAALAAAGVGLVGCGGTSSPSLSASEFRAQANAICHETSVKGEALPEPHSADEFRDLSVKVLAISRERQEALAKLDPPADLSDGLDELLRLQKQRDDAGQEVARKAANDPANAKAILDGGNQATLPLKTQVAEVSTRLGLTDCVPRSLATTTTSTTAATTSTETPTAGPADALDSFRAAADQACDAFNTEARAVPKPARASGLAPYLDDMIAAAARRNAALAALTAPEDLATEYNGLVSNEYQLQLDDLKTIRATMPADPAGAKQAWNMETSTVEDLNSEIVRISLALGLTCASTITFDPAR